MESYGTRLPLLLLMNFVYAPVITAQEKQLELFRKD